MMDKPDFSFEKRYWRKGYKIVIGVDEVGRGALAGPVVAAAAAIKFKIKNEKSNPFDKLRVDAEQSRSIKITKQKLKLSKIKKLYSLNTKYQILNIISQLGIDDSKRLSPKKRKLLAREIKQYFYFGIGQAGNREIDRKGIVKATEKAMRSAIKKLISKFEYRNSKLAYTNRCHTLIDKQESNRLSSLVSTQGSTFPKLGLLPNRWILDQVQDDRVFVLVDAFHVKYIPGVGLKRQQAIVKGDQRSISIAAASILAKVYRDSLMRKISKVYRKYHFEKNKGYGTLEHRQAIKKYGICKLHRRSYMGKLISF